MFGGNGELGICIMFGGNGELGLNTKKARQR